MAADLASFDGTKRTIDDLARFDENINELFKEWDESTGHNRHRIKSSIRLKLLREVGCLPGLSMEENLIEFRRNIAVLRLKLKQMEMRSEKSLKSLVASKEMKLDNMMDVRKREREKWRTHLQQLLNENAALKNGDFFCKTPHQMMTDIQAFIDQKDLVDKNEIIFAHKQQIEILKFENKELKAGNAFLQSRFVDESSKQNEIRQLESSTARMLNKKRIIELSESFNGLKSDYDELQSVMRSQNKSFETIMSQTTEQMVLLIEKYNARLMGMSNKYKEAMQLKRRFFNQIQNLKGNIRVFARSRPILPIDGDNQRSIVNFLDDKTLEVAISASDKAARLFSFDKIFDADSTQEEVYKDVSPLIGSVMDGYNCCIFAYGQTGSGKTYTMQGDASNPGVNIRALEHLFFIAEQRKPDFAYQIKVSMIEIYNEKIRDLLVNKQKEYKIRKGKTGNYIENVSIHDVKCEADVYRMMKTGAKNRSVTCTNSNETSSRSHMILTISVIGTNAMARLMYLGKLNLIDLAGSERINKSGVTGDQLKEALNINKSLSALGDVIAALSKKSKHIPFRNSTLTHMLQDSLGGNAKTLMFTNISPAQNHYGETLNALKFAQRAKTVELGPSRKSVVYQGHESSLPDEAKTKRRKTVKLSPKDVSRNSLMKPNERNKRAKSVQMKRKSMSSKLFN